MSCVRKDYRDRRNCMKKWIRWQQESSQPAIDGVHFALSPRSGATCRNARVRLFCLEGQILICNATYTVRYLKVCCYLWYAFMAQAKEMLNQKRGGDTYTSKKTNLRS